MLTSLILDDQLFDLGVYSFRPMQLDSHYFAGSYAESTRYKNEYKTLTTYFGTNIIPMPFAYWSDSTNFMNMSTGGPANCAMLQPLLFSCFQQSLCGKGTRIIGFTKDNDINIETSSTVKTNLHYMNKSKAFFMFLQQMKDISKFGIKSQRGHFLP